MKKHIGVIMYETSKSKGQELVAQRMVSYFKRLGHEAYLITSVFHDGKEVANEDSMGKQGYVLLEDSELGIPIIRVTSFLAKWPPRRIVFKDVVHTLERIANDFQLNVLITHSTLWNGPEEVAKFVEWRRNIKALGGYQDPLVFCHMSHYQEPSARRYSLVERSFRMAWNRLSLGTILRVANLVLVVTPLEERSKIKMGVSREKCVLFPGGVDDYSFAKLGSVESKELLRELGIEPNKKIVSYIGSIEPRKNPIALLDVAEQLKQRTDIHFIIAGRGHSEYAEKTRRRAGELANVHYLGEIDERTKIQLINVSCLNIILSRTEALGVAQLEFMFLGVPVVTSAVGGQSWLIRDGQDGIHVRGPRDTKGAAQAIVNLVDDRVRWQKLSASARERADSFTFSNLIEKLDIAITKELERESGLSNLPPEVRSTLSEPELVVGAWSRGTQKVVATEKRMFIQSGRLSRGTLEVRYTSIQSIEYIRRYQWKTLLIGLILSTLLFVQHYVFPIASIPVTSWIATSLATLLANHEFLVPRILAYFSLIPLSAALVLFAIGARRGYALHGATLKPIYLPQSFSEAIEHMRQIQDQASNDDERSRSRSKKTR